MVDPIAKTRLAPILAEFRKSIAHHCSEGASEERIKRIISEADALLSSQVADLEFGAWICEEFTNAAMPAPIIASILRTERATKSLC
jgi:hypothetical protein